MTEDIRFWMFPAAETTRSLSFCREEYGEM